MKNNIAMSRVGVYYRNYQLSQQKHVQQFEILRDFFAKEGIKLISVSSDQDLDDIINLEYPDFIIFYDKDLYRAQLCEDSKIRVFNCVDTILTVDDKALTYLVVKKGVEQNKNLWLIPSIFSTYPYFGDDKWKSDFLEKAVRTIGYPFILKATKGSLGQQVFLINDSDDFTKAINLLPLQQVIAQEFIQSSFGKDLRVWVVGNEVVAAVVRDSGSSKEFRSSVSLGGHYAEEFELTSEQIKLVTDISRSLTLDFGTIDFLFGLNNQLYFCEANSNAVFSNLNKNIGEAIVSYILRKTYDSTK